MLVKVLVSDEEIRMVNTITPNGDGKNDYWLIKGIANYPDSRIEIYNRYGQKVFESIGYKEPFNGKRNATDLPVGTYYYIIDLKSGCSLLKGALTIIR